MLPDRDWVLPTVPIDHRPESAPQRLAQHYVVQRTGLETVAGMSGIVTQPSR